MSEKYMKVKRVIIPTITMVIIASQLFGCSAVSQQELYDMSQSTSEVELEVAIMDTETEVETETEAEILHSNMHWEVLSQLATHSEFRTTMESVLDIESNADGTKSGSIYVNPETLEAEQNSTLLYALRNPEFASQFFYRPTQRKLEEEIVSEYVDLEENEAVAMSAIINAYFELLPDSLDGYFNGDETLTRAQAMTLVTRATTPVPEEGTLATDEDFIATVGFTDYTDFSAPLNTYAYINTSKGLNENTFDGAMTRGEYIYLLTNYLCKDYVGEIEDIELIEIEDGGEVSFADAINDPLLGCPTELYNAIKKAVALGMLSESDIRWEEPVTKSEAIELFINTANALYNPSYIEAGSTVILNSEAGDYLESISDEYEQYDADTQELIERMVAELLEEEKNNPQTSDSNTSSGYDPAAGCPVMTESEEGYVFGQGDYSELTPGGHIY